MANQAHITTAITPAANTLSTNGWLLAKKRAYDYLALHHLPAAQCERLVEQVSQKLLHSPAHTEQALIQQFMQTIRQELTFEQAQPANVAQHSESMHDVSFAERRMESRNQTGPRFERSSIRVAPLQAITLRLLRSRQLHRQH